ncbi:hypothetical protein ILUMI_23967 [Ignelater luminosus]|uniref:Uncharacterized protein n=1 Tax=Ignelater luminosus TaxID=2038154 RepID=A0A8K0C742_IGNLU|nr:hypothetical protein ILUMI_23967 [Ignelater luminosus]
MYFQIITVVVLTTVLGATVSSKESVKIVRQINNVYPDGTYNHAFETENEIYAEEQGFIKNPSDDNNGIQTIQGQFQYQSPEGQVMKLIYVADENGFQPQAEYLPTPPPIPPLIEKALKYLASLDVSKVDSTK